MSFLNRSHATQSNRRMVRWDAPTGQFAFSAKEGNSWVNKSVRDFCMDVWKAEHGYETWEGPEGGKHRVVRLASVMEPLPEAPPGATSIYSVPIYSKFVGHECDLVIKGIAVCGAFCDLFDQLADDPKIDQTVAPVVEVSVTSTEFGSAPVFKIIDWVERPVMFGKPVVKFAH